MGWRFALINNRLAEIYFEKNSKGKLKFRGHCYVKRSEYGTKKEQKWIDADTAEMKFSYRKRKYRRKT